MPKSFQQIQEILDLNPNNAISPAISNRQLEVIRKSYNYLIKSAENNIIYIADEVGLGKTYIAMGIMALLRHHYNNPLEKDMIVVPKANLQDKWESAIGVFYQYNLLKKFDDQEQYKERYNPIKYHKIQGINADSLFHIFRTSSFSNIAFVADDEVSGNTFYRKLVDEHFHEDEFIKEILKQANKKHYFKHKNNRKLGHLLAYLFNIKSSKIGCLVIDEAHNYKYGPGNEDWFSSIRNNVTSRFLGAYRDQQILEDFPALESKIKFPLANKIVCLSATPKDRCLNEIKNQFDCFVDKHILSDCQSPEEIKTHLPKFLIRGNMEYQLDTETYSRNQSRHEHRSGNVNKSLTPEKLEIKDDFEGTFWQLLQYQSLKHLKLKNGFSFEMGMLAGFESYKVDTDKKLATLKEYDVEHKKDNRESQDINVVRSIIDSYKRTFKLSLPPHPKQSKFEAEILHQMHRQEKSLTFVRRIMTVNDLEKRLLHLYEKEVVVEKQLRFKRPYTAFGESDKIKSMLDDWSQKDHLSKLPVFIDELLNCKAWKKTLKRMSEEELDKVREFIKSLFGNESSDFKSRFIVFQSKPSKIAKQRLFAYLLEIFQGKQVEKVNIQHVNSSINGSFANQDLGTEIEGSEDDEDVDNLDKNQFDGYFFSTYFSYGNGFRFKAKMYRENWFEIDISYLLNYLKLFQFDQVKLVEDLKNIKLKTKKPKKNQLFAERQNTIRDYMLQNESTLIKNTELKHTEIPIEGFDEFNIEAENTFLTQLLIKDCHGELNNWLTKVFHIDNSLVNLIHQLEYLSNILRNIFRNGSGLLPSFVAECNENGESFEQSLLMLIKDENAPFHHVLEEVKCILNDFDILMNTNFNKKTKKEIDNMFRTLSPVVAVSGQIKRDRSLVAAQFRMPGFPYALISTDILREGEDLHTYCQNVYHYGIAWNPSDMEQRTGRIDRINSLSFRNLNRHKKLDFDHKIQVFYPYLSQSIEVNQVNKLLKNMNQFTETFNDVGSNVVYDREVNIQEEVETNGLPAAIQNKINPLYDVWSFRDELEEVKVEL